MGREGGYRFNKQIVQAIEDSPCSERDFTAAAKTPDEKGNYDVQVFRRLMGEGEGGATLQEFLSFCIAVQQKLNRKNPYTFGDICEKPATLPDKIRDCPATHLPAGIRQTTGDRVLSAPSSIAAWVVVAVVVPFLIVALCLATIARTKTPPGVPSKGIPGALEPSGMPETLMKVRIEATIEIKLWRLKSTGDTTFKGVVGKDTFNARQGDQVDIAVKLSRPGYGYIVALRGDNKIELCSPLENSAVPLQGSEIVYRNRGKQYVLSEAPGVWVFVVIASDEPLPPFEKWAAAEKATWTAPLNPDAGKVWICNGDVLSELTADGARDPILGTDDKNRGTVVAIREALYQLLGENADVDVTGSAIGFVVEPKRDP
jgi:hypothetical protein